MLAENIVAKIFDSGLQQGADFTEVFVEDSVSSSINLLDQKIDEINSSKVKVTERNDTMDQMVKMAVEIKQVN